MFCVLSNKQVTVLAVIKAGKQLKAVTKGNTALEGNGHGNCNLPKIEFDLSLRGDNPLGNRSIGREKNLRVWLRQGVKLGNDAPRDVRVFIDSLRESERNEMATKEAKKK